MRHDRGFRLSAAALAAVCFVLGSERLQAQDFRTDTNGLITTSSWLALGPFSNPHACTNNPDALLMNHIGPVHHIACEFPEEDDIVEGYDPTDPSVGSTGVHPAGADPDGSPIWRAFDDGSDDGDQNNDGDVAGDIIDHMTWMVTYFRYTGASPTLVEVCAGSDDDIQIWLDDNLVHNLAACRGRAFCQDRFGVVITPGLHAWKIAAWENEGGWGLSLGMIKDGLPLVDDGSFPDFEFLGREGGAELRAQFADCENPDPPVPQKRVTAMLCGPNAAGGLDISWTNPVDADISQGFTVYAGPTIKNVPANASSASLTAAELGDATTICVRINTSMVASCCNTTKVDPTTGLIRGGAWMTVGPFANPFGCNGDNNSILNNHVAPSFLGCEYPALGDPLQKGYDPAQSVSTGIHPATPVDGDGVPIWRVFDDGSDDGDLNFDGDIPGDLNDHVLYVATYIEYTGDGPFSGNLCTGSDDGIQIWCNDAIVHNNNACRGRGVCQDIVAFTFPEAGLYRFIVGVWERGGGWGGSLGIQDPNGGYILDDHPDFIFHGSRRPADYASKLVSLANPPAPDPTVCPTCTSPVKNLACAFGRVGFGTGVIMTWENPDEIDVSKPTQIIINGEVVASPAANLEGASISEGLLPDVGPYAIEVRNCSGFSVSCSPFQTDVNGLILTKAWLALGPIRNSFGCNGNNDSILGNHIAPSHIAAEYPKAGDVVEYDPTDPTNVSLGLHPSAPQTQDGDLIWYDWVDGTPANGDQDMDQSPAGNIDDHNLWLATYVEYKGEGGNFNLCVGSDDGVQVWRDCTLVHNNNACRGRGVCQDTVPMTLDGPGVFCFKISAWERGGGWGASLAIQDEFNQPIIDDGNNPDWVFHGRTPPTGYTPPACASCLSVVQNLACTRNANGSVALSWQNPQGCNGEISIRIYGEELTTLPAGSTSFTIPAADAMLPGVVQVDNGSFAFASCSLITADDFVTDQGFISGWLHLGPLAYTTSDCLSDYLTDGAESELTIEPKDGDQIVPDYGGAAASLSLKPAEVCPDCNPDGIPTWKEFLNVGDQFDVNVRVSMGDNQMSYGVFYVDVPEDITVDVGVASDDGIQVLAAPIGDDIAQIHCNIVARGVGGVNSVQDVIRDVNLTRGQWKFMVKVFEIGGGHGWRLRFQRNGAPLVPGTISLEPGAPTPRETNCGDGQDNDGDGRIDCLDSDCQGTPACQGIKFIRGDCNADGSVNIADASYLLNFLFLGGRDLLCLITGDANDDGGQNIADASFILNFLFLGGRNIPQPNACADPGETGGDCASYPPCGR